LQRKAAILFLVMCAMWAVPAFLPGRDFCLAETSMLDSYFEDFNDRQDDATIVGVDFWSLIQGNVDSALTESGLTVSGSGKALRLIGTTPVVDVGRSEPYGGLTPTWIRFSVRPPHSAQNPTAPNAGIGAVCFSYDGKVLAADGSSWADTGMAYTVDHWYDVAMEIDFQDHRYDLYVNPSDVPPTQFIAIKTGLRFIDPSINSLSRLDFSGAYSSGFTGNDVYIDDLSVTYIDRLEIVTPPQKLMQEQVSGPITVQLHNVLSEPQTAISDITLDLKSTSLSGKFSLNAEPWSDVAQVIIPKNSQQAVFYYKDYSLGKPLITVTEFPERGYIDASQQMEIVSKAATFDVEVAPQQLTAGADFSIKITARDKNGNVDESFAGSIDITPTYVSPANGNDVISPNNVSGFAKGKLEVNANYPDCGLITINVADSQNPLSIGTSAPLLFLPASFALSVEPSQTVSKPFNLTLTAKNALGAITPNYDRAVSLHPMAISPLDISLGALSPATVAGDGFREGVATVSISYNLYGRIKIRAESSDDARKQGTSEEITFLPKGISVGIDPPPGERGFFYIGEPVNINVRVLDELGNPIINYPGIVALTSNFGPTLPAPYAFTTADAGQHKFTATSIQSGDFVIVVTAENGTFRVDSPRFTVKNVTIQVVDTTSPIGTGEVMIQLVDESGKIITTENHLVVNMRVIEEFDNNSSSWPMGTINLIGGIAIVPVSDSEEETVTLVPVSPFKINVKKGTIKFGPPSKGGINPLLWRELKGKK
jgi:hypothetical protein